MLGCQFSHDFSSFRDLRWLFCYFHVPRARWVPHPTKFIPKQCSIQWASERYWFELSMRCKLWDICEKHTNIHTYIHTYIHTWPKPVFHRLLDFGFAPSARSLRLNYRCIFLGPRWDPSTYPSTNCRYTYHAPVGCSRNHSLKMKSCGMHRECRFMYVCMYVHTYITHVCINNHHPHIINNHHPHIINNYHSHI